MNECATIIGLSDISYANISSIIDQSAPLILGNYPIYDESYRPILNRKIIYHYFFREIGAETGGLFRLFINRKMNEIMPYYNQLYKSAMLDFNPLHDYDLTRQHLTKNTGEQTSDGISSVENNSKENSNTTNSNTNTNAFSDTPHGELSNVENNKYLTDYRVINDNGNSESNSNSSQMGESKSLTHVGANNTEEYIESVKGKGGGKSFSEMISDYRNILLNIDMQIISDLEECFMMIY